MFTSRCNLWQIHDPTEYPFAHVVPTYWDPVKFDGGICRECPSNSGEAAPGLVPASGSSVLFTEELNFPDIQSHPMGVLEAVGNIKRLTKSYHCPNRSIMTTTTDSCLLRMWEIEYLAGISGEGRIIRLSRLWSLMKILTTKVHWTSSAWKLQWNSRLNSSRVLQRTI